jgi:hypothetical protein
LKIRRHSAGLEFLTNLPLKAANVNLASGVNATDALRVQLRIVGLMPTFEAGDWVFGTATPINIVSTDVTYDFKALATADVNGSYDSWLLTSNKAVNYTNLQKEGIALANESQEYELPIRVNDVLSLGAVTLDLSYNQNLIDVTGVSSQLSGLDYNIVNGKILLAWSNTTPVSLQPNDVLVTVKVKAKDAITSSADLFSVSGNSEFADESGKVVYFSSLKVNSIETDSRTYGINVYPNPFKNNVEIDYNLIEAGKVTLVIYNSVGQKMNVLVDENKAAGNYKFNLNTSDLPSGVYTCEILINGKTSDYQKVIKLVKTK